MDLPTFRYHPDPLASGAIKKESGICACCGKHADYMYVASAYSSHDLRGKLCPWCIADGSAHDKFDVEFSDSVPLSDDGIPEHIIEEVVQRTPGFISWQQEV
ncbi:MAG: CbrC family protein [Planctomycetaceae bacterium]|nr:CbrC family protein [Planctomycetaceae bacterium]